jgi:hypothetical protein
MSAASAASRGGVAPLQAVVLETLRGCAVSLLAVDRVSGGKEAGCHVAAHVPEADEANPRCRRSGHLTPSPSIAAMWPSPKSVGACRVSRLELSTAVRAMDHAPNEPAPAER